MKFQRISKLSDSNPTLQYGETEAQKGELNGQSILVSGLGEAACPVSPPLETQVRKKQETADFTELLN